MSVAPDTMAHVARVSVTAWKRGVSSGEFVSLADAAGILGLTRMGLYNWMRAGDRLPKRAVVRHPSGRRYDGIRYRRSVLTKMAAN